MNMKQPPLEGLRARKRREVRQRISNTATRLFLERGFDAVPVEEVALAADVSRATVFNYFECKEDLLLDRAPELAERVARALKAADGRGASGSPRCIARTGDCRGPAQRSSPGDQMVLADGDVDSFAAGPRAPAWRGVRG